jgi:hypothetical protein
MKNERLLYFIALLNPFLIIYPSREQFDWYSHLLSGNILIKI